MQCDAVAKYGMKVPAALFSTVPVQTYDLPSAGSVKRSRATAVPALASAASLPERQIRLTSQVNAAFATASTFGSLGFAKSCETPAIHKPTSAVSAAAGTKISSAAVS